jgi:hypothetical protein
MPLNPYFEQMISTSGQQDLHEELINEYVAQAGVEAYYLPRASIAIDEIFREEQIARFENAIPIALYIETVDSFGGQREFLSNFGHEIRDRITFTLTKREFDLCINPITEAPRPKEGDLIWLPMTGGLYELMFLDQESQSFYQFGKLHAYQLVCELFEYNNEEFNTGIPDIDYVEDIYSTNSTMFFLTDEDGVSLTDEYGEELLYTTSTSNLEEQDNTQQNEEFEDESFDIIDFTVVNPFSERIT